MLCEENSELQLCKSALDFSNKEDDNDDDINSDKYKVKSDKASVPRIFLKIKTCIALYAKHQIFGNIEQNTYVLYRTLGVESSTKIPSG
ncbi:16809_t:CDS:2 [Dentiscutata erythropus]|uniref:16809_t:CDS:1 n=1 Tax=Dentiscutata erythropus TaxID=1348616 RepID=A0A9N9HKV2_9GLOM|nr:16809_t:CDS:2 [Dentiscutata erythropus]